MSKVLPAKQFHSQSECDEENVCPRYQKWMKRINKKNESTSKHKGAKSDKSPRYMSLFRNSKRKRNKNRSGSISSEETLCSKKSHSNNSNGKSKEKKPLRSKSFFFRIRQKGRNFGIRCKTSVELWRKWIKRGIRWDRHQVPKPADIDIINKPESKLKDFSKKSIITEVIPEEDEEDTESIVSRPKQPAAAPEQPQPAAPQVEINQIKDRSPERNFLSDMSYIQRASNLFRNTNSTSKPKQEVKANGHTEDRTNGQAKYPMQDLASMDIGHIEKLDSSDEQQSNGTSQRLSQQQSKPAARGAIHRAFNKLKLFF